MDDQDDESNCSAVQELILDYRKLLARKETKNKVNVAFYSEDQKPIHARVISNPLTRHKPENHRWFNVRNLRTNLVTSVDLPTTTGAFYVAYGIDEDEPDLDLIVKKLNMMAPKLPNTPTGHQQSKSIDASSDNENLSDTEEELQEDDTLNQQDQGASSPRKQTNPNLQFNSGEELRLNLVS